MYNYSMSSPHSGEYELPSRTPEVIAEHVSNEFLKKWLDLGLHTDDYDLGKVNEGEYYRTANAFANRHNFSEGQARELVNFEIHMGLNQPHSAEFKLLATPMSSDLLKHIALLDADVSVDQLASDAGARLSHTFLEEHKAIEKYAAINPGLAERIALTRTVGSYSDIQRVKRSTEEFLDGFHADEFTTQQEVDEIRKYNLGRIYEWNMQLRTIEKLVATAVQPLSPSEYTEVVEKYLIKLIKEHEDRLNPYSDGERPQLPGSIALQAFFENHTGKDYPSHNE